MFPLQSLLFNEPHLELPKSPREYSKNVYSHPGVQYTLTLRVLMHDVITFQHSNVFPILR